MATFGDVWKLVTLHAPVPDALLAREWVQWAYAEFCDRRGWSHLRAETNITVNNQKAGGVTFVQGSATASDSGIGFASSDVGRQLRVTSIPIYTINAFTPGAPNTVTLNRAYSEVPASPGPDQGTILDAYVTMPEDFHRFISVLDPVNRWRLRFWVTQDQLNRWDPPRMSTGNARLLASQAYSPVPGFTAQARYELYPFQTSFRTYPVWYFRKPEYLSDSQEIIGPLARRSREVLLEGALHRAALWPGVEGRKNPYFSLQLADKHRQLFEEKISQINVVDEELYFEGMPLSEFPFADFPWDATWWQSHEPFIVG